MTEDEGKYVCKWCGDSFDSIQALGGHTRKEHKDKPSVHSIEGMKMLGMDTEKKGDSLEKEAEISSFFTAAGQKLFDELRDSGKRVNKKNIVHHFENGNIDSTDWMNYCLRVGGIDRAARLSILSTHYGVNAEPILNREKQYGSIEGISDIPVAPQHPENPMDDIMKIAKQDMQLAQMEHYTERYRQRTLSPPKPDNGGDKKIEIPLPSPFNPREPLRDAEGNIVTTVIDPKQIMMQQQFNQNTLKGDNSGWNTGWEKAFETLKDSMKSNEQGKDIQNNPAFVSMKEQLNATKEMMTRVLQENKDLKEHQRLQQMEGRIMQRIDQVEAKTHSEVELWHRMTNVLRSEGLLPEGKSLFGFGGQGTPEQTMAIQTFDFIKNRADNISKQVDKFGTIVSSDVRRRMLDKEGKPDKKQTKLPKLEDSKYEQIMKEIEQSEGYQQEKLD